MKTTKLILGILSGVFFVVIALQSCVTSVGDALADNGGTGGIGGIMLSFCLLGAFFGFITGGYADLQLWSGLCAAFGVFFIISAIVMKKQSKAAGKNVKGE